MANRKDAIVSCDRSSRARVVATLVTPRRCRRTQYEWSALAPDINNSSAASPNAGRRSARLLLFASRKLLPYDAVRIAAPTAVIAGGGATGATGDTTAAVAGVIDQHWGVA